MDVSIIIVNYNTIGLLIDAIDSIFDKTIDLAFEIIVVDNNSTDNSKFLLSKKYGSQVIYVPLLDNIGFGRANNEGVKIAKGRNVLFLNPDTMLINNAIKILSDYLDANLKVGACGGNLYDEDMRPIHSFRRILPSILFEINNLMGGFIEKVLYGKNIDFCYSSDSLEVSYITGADLMIRNSVLNEVGGFDPLFFMYYEETDLCYRISKAGYKLKCLGKAKIQHLEGGAFLNKKVNKKRIFMIEKSRKIFYSLHYPKIYVSICNLLYYLSIQLRISFFKKRDSFKYDYWVIRKNIFKEN